MRQGQLTRHQTGAARGGWASTPLLSTPTPVVLAVWDKVRPVTGAHIATPCAVLDRSQLGLAAGAEVVVAVAPARTTGQDAGAVRAGPLRDIRGGVTGVVAADAGDAKAGAALFRRRLIATGAGGVPELTSAVVAPSCRTAVRVPGAGRALPGRRVAEATGALFRAGHTLPILGAPEPVRCVFMIAIR